MAISTLLKQRSAAFFDGMALAIAVGRCWVNLAATVPGFRPIPENQTMLVGARDFDVNERRLLNASDVDLEDPGRIRKMGLSAGLKPNLDKIRTRAERAYLHIDLDVLDPTEARVNQFSALSGLTLGELLEIVRLVRELCLPKTPSASSRGASGRSNNVTCQYRIALPVGVKPKKETA